MHPMFVCMHGGGRRRRGGWGPGGPGYGRGGPRARRGNVREAILALLAERPMHGYEMIQELENRTEGIWRPSAGSIYPTLALLEDEGLLTSEESDGKRRYSLTDAGRAEAERRGERPPWERLADEADAPGPRLREAAMQVGAAVMQVARTGSDEQVARTQEILTDARRRIYGILAENGDS